MRTPQLLLRYYIFIIPFFSSTYCLAQIEKQTDSTAKNFASLFSTDRLKLLNNVDVLANMQFSQFNNFTNGNYTGSAFAMNQFRLEVKGDITEEIYFRFRDRYTRLPEPQTKDVISRSVDLAFIRYDASPKWNFQFGKMCADWGGYEFDTNPIEIYEYNDLINNSDNFLSGAQVQYISSPRNAFTFQVLNSRTQTFAEIYDSIPNITEAKFPIALVGNWRGNWGDGKFTTLWSYSIFQEAKNKSMHYVALGNRLNLDKFTAIYDFKWSDQDIDRTGIVSDIVPENVNPYAALDARYVEHWLEFRYKIAPKWNIQAVGMVSTAHWYANPQIASGSQLRTSWGINPTVEFYPKNNINLRFFGTFVHRIYNFSNYASTQWGYSDFNTSRFAIGFVSPLLVL